jgi:hypothetical protein
MRYDIYCGCGDDKGAKQALKALKTVTPKPKTNAFTQFLSSIRLRKLFKH